MQGAEKLTNKTINCIPNSMEKCISFSIGQLDFLDSLQFINASLEKLVSNLAKEGDGKFHVLKRTSAVEKRRVSIRLYGRYEQVSRATTPTQRGLLQPAYRRAYQRWRLPAFTNSAYLFIYPLSPQLCWGSHNRARLQIKCALFTLPTMIHHRRQSTTPGTTCPTLCDKCAGAFTSHRIMNIEGLWDGTTGLSSLSEKTRELNHLQM